MTSSATLTTIRDRIEVLLRDTSNYAYSTATLDENIRLVIAEFSSRYPQEKDTVIILPGDGREIALDSLTGLIQVMEVWYPYDSTASTETWPPNKIPGFSLRWDDGRPVLFLDQLNGLQPQQDDEMRVFYTAKHTLDGLDSASGTTLPDMADHIIVIGATAYSAFGQIAERSDSFNNKTLERLGNAWMREYRILLEDFKAYHYSTRTPPWTGGWSLDKWDGS
jgi:hypothetical protein